MIGFRASASISVATSLACALLIAPGCGTDAQGIDDCRNIEQARCAAAANCGDLQGSGSGKVVVDVGSCQRFYRDQCLHGTTTPSPGAPDVDRCVRAIRAAGECAGAEALCTAPGLLTPESACEKILRPELLSDCRFLTPDPENIPGEGGTTGASAGAGGQGGDAAGSGAGGSTAAGGVGSG